MELILRITTPDRTTHDVIVGLDQQHTVAELACALADHAGVARRDWLDLTVARTGRTLDADGTIGDAELMSGDEVVLGTTDRPSPPPDLPRHAVTADVLAGPESGRSLVMLPGRYRVGRSTDCDLSIDDRSVSRHHADVEYTADGVVTIHPMPDTANGVTVNDDHIDDATPVNGDDVVGLGGTRLGFRPFERSLDEHVDRLGQLDFHRTPYRPPIVVERDDQVVGPIPERPEPRRLQTMAVLAPLAGGLAMYAFSRQPQFLALTAISPIAMISNVIEDRKSGRRKFRDQLAAFKAGLGDHRDRLARLRHTERVERLRTAPDLADLSRRAELRTVDLWARGRDSPDFLRARIGLGTAAVSFGIDLDLGGDDDLRAELRAVIDDFDHIDNVPISVDLVTDSVLGVHGERSLVDGVVASLGVQAATLHSPEDLTIVAAIDAERPFDWLKWLPHVRSVASPLPGNHVVHTPEEATAVVSRLVEVARFRAAGSRRDDDHRVWPRLLLVIDGSLAPDPVEVSRLLEVGPPAGVAVIWMAGSLAGIPRQAAQVLDVRQGEGAAMLGRLWSTDPDVADRSLEVEHLRPGRADLVARALAPVRDASTASLATSIPRTAPLLDVLGVGRPSPQWVTEQWLAATEYDLKFPIGLAADGPLEIDLVENGPHSLIGGTSGAGKSELLQSMVAALAVRHPPNRLNFLFVDYKGGASSKVFERLPHTVGYVTNLSADLSVRALVSLRAELNRRMQIMEGIAKDLDEMLEKAPDQAPASLVIMVDEFATLVKEVPEFVAGVVDIAQRGRSLGIHLVLATQRPSGSVNENILANTNLRMSLRMLDRTESSSVIDSPDAADIPVPLRGRGFVRLGPRQLVEFQSSFAGAPLLSGDTRAPVLIAPFARTDDSPRALAGGPSDEPTETHLSAILDAIEGANDLLGYPEPRRPWRDVLDPVIGLDSVMNDAGTDDAHTHPGRFVTVGMLDAPETQDQRPAVVDLEDGGGWLIFGSGGSGKTTLLRTVATSISRSARGGDVAIIGFDFASRGLASIKPLPEVVDVVAGDDLEAVTRHLSVLDGELTRRRRLLGDVGAEHLTAYNRLEQPLPRIVLLIDGFGALASTFLGATGPSSTVMEQWGEIVQRLVIDGRQAGIHAVITADRSNAVPSRVHSAVANRLILRHADTAAYAEYGISGDRARDLDLPPGRGLLDGTTLLQIASAGDDHTAKGQADAIAAVAEQLDRPAASALASSRLPADISAARLDTLGRADPGLLQPRLGVTDVSGTPIAVDLEYSSLVVCGTPRSGRSTALGMVARSLAARHGVTAIGPTTSPLGSFELGDGVDVTTGRPDSLVEPLDRLANLLAMGAPARPQILVVDDADLLDDMALISVFERLTASDDLRIVASMESRSLTGYTQSPLLNALRRTRRLLVLRPDDPNDFLTTTGVKLTLRPGTELPPGRGVLLVDRLPTVVQVAHP